MDLSRPNQARSEKLVPGQNKHTLWQAILGSRSDGQGHFGGPISKQRSQAKMRTASACSPTGSGRCSLTPQNGAEISLGHTLRLREILVPGQNKHSPTPERAMVPGRNVRRTGKWSAVHQDKPEKMVSSRPKQAQPQCRTSWGHRPFWASKDPRPKREQARQVGRSASFQAKPSTAREDGSRPKQTQSMAGHFGQ